MSWFPLSDATQADAQCINQDISRYLSKYLSKEKRNDSTDSAYHPASWWGVDNATRREAKAERVRLQIGGISVETLRLAYDAGRVALSTWSDKVFTFTNPIFVGFGGQVGFCEPGSDLSALSYFVRWLDSHGFEYCLEQGV
jgi:hypothetical protein